MAHHHEDDSTATRQAMAILIEEGLEGMPRAMQILLNVAMKIERSEFLRAGPYERTPERRGYANGSKSKTVKSRTGPLQLQIPQVRGLAEGEAGFYPQAFERGLRSERALTMAIAEMYVKGVSTRKVVAITEKLCGLSVSSTQVSRAAQQLDEELASWRERELGETPALILDARYEKVRQGGKVLSAAVLLAVGVLKSGKRSVLGVSVSLSEAEVHWRELLASLKQRGLIGVRVVVSDDHAGLRAALEAELPGVAWQRCQFHLQQNAQAYVPRVSMRKRVASEIRGVFNAFDRADALQRLGRLVDTYRKPAPKLAAWLEENIPEGLTTIDYPAVQRRRLRTTNALERLNKEIKRRTRVATLFPNEASLLRLVTAVVAEISDEWETGRIYINWKSE